jgi:hypothetical protein
MSTGELKKLLPIVSVYVKDAASLRKNRNEITGDFSSPETKAAISESCRSVGHGDLGQRFIHIKLEVEIGQFPGRRSTSPNLSAGGMTRES